MNCRYFASRPQLLAHAESSQAGKADVKKVTAAVTSRFLSPPGPPPPPPNRAPSVASHDVRDSKFKPRELTNPIQSCADTQDEEDEPTQPVSVAARAAALGANRLSVGGRSFGGGASPAPAPPPMPPRRVSSNVSASPEPSVRESSPPPEAPTPSSLSSRNSHIQVKVRKQT
jgi:hypothetical protein